jgi:hypothetical protein
LGAARARRGTAPLRAEETMKLDLDQLQVTSFETQTPESGPLPAVSGEDCFTFLSTCCTHTTFEA